MDPNYAGARVLLVTLLYFDGRAQQTVGLLKKAIALNPHHPYNYTFHLAQVYFIIQRYDEAIDTLNKILESNPGAERIHVWLAASLARAGRTDDGRCRLFVLTALRLRKRFGGDAGCSSL